MGVEARGETSLDVNGWLVSELMAPGTPLAVLWGLVQSKGSPGRSLLCLVTLTSLLIVNLLI